tara:strand:- start:301 stop:525 length:225 start_codon:yes stop_codon:yes gene_type:complete
MDRENLVSNYEKEGFIKVQEKTYINKEILKDIRIIKSSFNETYYEIWYGTSIITIFNKDSPSGTFRIIFNMINF